MTQENSTGLFFAQTRAKIENYLVQKQALYLHASLFVMALLIGIARYGHGMSQGLTTLVALWSVALLIHGVLVYRARTITGKQAGQQHDGILIAALFFTTVNGLMWIMWTLATDARDGMPWHYGVMLSWITLSAVGVIAGKRALYRHWLNEYLRNSGEQPGDAKRKRLTKIDDDGELDDAWLDEDDHGRTSSDTQ